MSYVYSEELRTIGDHVRAVRLDRGLLQREVAAEIGCDVSSVLNWEKKGSEPALKHMPGIIEFLGYCPYFGPLDFTQTVITWRKLCGISRTELAEILEVDPSSVWKFESGQTMNPDFRKDLLSKLRCLMTASP